MKAVFHTRWLLIARRIIDRASADERKGLGMVLVSFGGRPRHWSEWDRIWHREKAKLLKKLTLAKRSSDSKSDTSGNHSS